MPHIDKPSQTSPDATAPMEIVQPPRLTEHAAAGLVLLYAPCYKSLRPAYTLDRSELVLGRDPDVDAYLPMSAASRRHARIHRRDGVWVLTDLGGRNGTIVNGELVGEIALKHLDEIRVGDAIFKFVERDAASYAHYRIDGAYFDDPSASNALPRFSAGELIGGYQMQRLVAGLRTVTRSGLAVLLGGESGTGKEVLARAVHDWSGRRGAFQAVNCAAIPTTLIEGALFGHRRGAFSGAERDMPGVIRAAHGGTLFLDEIGDMPLEAQAKLLRVIQSREIFPVGASQPEHVDVRVVCATHRDLVELQQKGEFRGDLFARLNEYSVMLPPLRQRKEDLFSLCAALAARYGRPAVRVTFPFMVGLLHHHFPYNVRELEALIKRWAAVGRGDELDIADLTDEMRATLRTYGVRGAVESTRDAAPALPDDLSPSSAAPAIPRRQSPPEHELRRWLAQHRGNVAAVARLVGRDRAQIHRWMRRYGIGLDEYR